MEDTQTEEIMDQSVENVETIEIVDNDVKNVNEDKPNNKPHPQKFPRRRRPRFSGEHYNNAYGDYRGGYGPGGGFGPPSFGPPSFGPSFGPQSFGPQNYGYGPGPMGPPEPPPLMYGRGFGPGGPPLSRAPYDDRAVKYLMRCGIPKQQLKNLPRDMLRLIEPQYCGLCAIEFDSFATSRLHYVSKNHIKAQKKWMTQNSEYGYFGNSKEVPFKARELYCELCDVHITSKTHAESHYAGRPHRAIVEGRRNPKNPFLLQKGMEGRLTQLVRREKKNLKALEEADVVEETEEVKPLQPELYCEICKTSVTCTEQMTMHLNGKKHLAKEKQHILRMMKGDTQENKQDDENGGGEGDEGEEEEEGNENGGNNDETQNESTEWENGTGDWGDASEM